RLRIRDDQPRRCGVRAKRECADDCRAREEKRDHDGDPDRPAHDETQPTSRSLQPLQPTTLYDLIKAGPDPSNHLARRLEPNCRFSWTSAAEGAWKVPVRVGPERKSMSTRPTRPDPNSM